MIPQRGHREVLRRHPVVAGGKVVCPGSRSLAPVPPPVVARAPMRTEAPARTRWAGPRTWEDAWLGW